MKPALIVPVVLAFALSAPPAAAGDPDLAFPTEAETKEEGVKVVKEFMELAVKEWVSDGKVKTQAECMKLLSPEYLKSRGIDEKEWKIDTFAFEEFEVQEVRRGYVVVKGTNRTNKWSHLLTFRLLKDDGKLRIEPSAATPTTDGKGQYITPWWAVKRFVK